MGYRFCINHRWWNYFKINVMSITFESLILDTVVSSIQQNSARNAFFINKQYYSYRVFGQRISAIRQVLNTKYELYNMVGLVANDDIDTYASIFALWLEGKTYVPLHPNQPLDRCMEIVNQVGIKLILDSSEKTRYDNWMVKKTSELDFTNEFLNDRINYPSETLAYILFTSGSTGNPKGVQITRGNVAAFIDSFWKTGIAITQDDRCLQCFDLTFDVSVQTYLTALIKGACCYTVPHGQMKYIYVSWLIDEYKITISAMAPSMIRHMNSFISEIDGSSMKICILTAEAVPLSVLKQWSSCVNNAIFFDFYGPTEATIYCSYYQVPHLDECKTINGILSIGKPLANVQSIIVNKSLELVNVGEEGELCVAGEQLTIGYWNDIVRNSEVFFEKEYNGNKYRFYHTGDWCYQDKDGDIMYIGRIDNQIKIQGYRIELGEIDFHARAFLNGVNSVSIPYEQDGITQIILFIESSPFNTLSLLSYLKTKLPAYMLPAKVQFMTRFPLNANEKVDKKQLKNSVLQ